ncbi:MAG: type II secretion system F family protein [Bdellovibrionales bacterium]|nr:type II secretion system F family protein [Bdellovibrionales bacterium]
MANSSNQLLLTFLITVSFLTLFYGIRFLLQAKKLQTTVHKRYTHYGRSAFHKSHGQRLGTLHQWLAETALGQSILAMLKEADLSWSIFTFAAIICGLIPAAMTALSLGLSITFQQNFILSSMLSIALVIGYFRSRRGVRERALQTQVPEIAILVGNNMRAGLTLQHALEDVVAKLPRPANEEFDILLNEMNMGKSTEKALKDFLNRHNGEEIRMLITALLIQIEAGGDLSKTLASISNAVLARQRINDEIRTSTAEGRYSSLAIVGLSIGVLFLLNMATGGVFSAFLQDREMLGWFRIGLDSLDKTPITIGFTIFLFVYVIPQAIAFVWIRRLGEVQI